MMYSSNYPIIQSSDIHYHLIIICLSCAIYWASWSWRWIIALGKLLHGIRAIRVSLHSHWRDFFVGQVWSLLVQIRYWYHIQKVKKPPNRLLFHQNWTSKVKSKVIWFLKVRWRQFRKNNFRGDFQTMISSSYRLLFSSNFFLFWGRISWSTHCNRLFTILVPRFFYKSQYFHLQRLGSGSSRHIFMCYFLRVRDFLSTFQIWYFMHPKMVA